MSPQIQISFPHLDAYKIGAMTESNNEVQKTYGAGSRLTEDVSNGRMTLAGYDSKAIAELVSNINVSGYSKSPSMPMEIFEQVRVNADAFIESTRRGVNKNFVSGVVYNGEPTELLFGYALRMREELGGRMNMLEIVETSKSLGTGTALTFEKILFIESVVWSHIAQYIYIVRNSQDTDDNPRKFGVIFKALSEINRFKKHIATEDIRFNDDDTLRQYGRASSMWATMAKYCSEF